MENNTNTNEKLGGASILSPTVAPVAAAYNSVFGKGSGQSSWQSGQGPESWTPEQTAILLGTHPGQIGYDSNQKGSFESKYNQVINSLSPDLLVKRYHDLNNQSYFNTGLDQLQKQAYDTAKSILGRDLSGSEFAQILPAFQGPNGLMNGRAFLANLAQQYKSNPSLDPMSSINQRSDGDINGLVTQQFQSILGRAPTADELQHFTDAIKTNQTDAYGLGAFLKQMPEYTNTQDKNFRNSLNDELSSYDTKEFGREKDSVLSQFARNGTGSGNSASLDYALTDLMGKIAENRSNYLAGLSAQQYGGNKDLAVGNYQNTLNQMYNTNQQNRQQQTGYGQQLLNQGFAGADYQTQMNNYMQMMNGMNQSRNVLHGPDYLNLGLQGLNAGAKIYGGYSYLNG